MLPAGCVSTHTVFCLRTPLPLARTSSCSAACSTASSLNYLVRLRVSTHVTTAVVERLPVPTRERAAGRPRDRRAVGAPVCRGGDPTAPARLQARVAALYQLSGEEFEHVLSTFPLVPKHNATRRSPNFQRGPKMNEPRRHGDTELQHLNVLTSQIIACAIEVHRCLGPGLKDGIQRLILWSVARPATRAGRCDHRRNTQTHRRKRLSVSLVIA